MANERNLHELFSDFTEECKYASQLSPETIRGYASAFLLFSNVMPEIVEVKYLAPEMLIEYFKRLQTRPRLVGRDTWKKGVKASTIKTYYGKLNAFFFWLERKALIQENPLSRINAPKVTYADGRALSEEEVRRIYAAITLHSQSAFTLRRDTAMVSLLVFCGLRLGEFISLEIRDIDFAKQLLTVRSNTSKSKKVRHIPLHATLQFHLRDYIAERNRMGYKTHFLLASSKADKGLSRHGLKHWVKSLCVKSGVKLHLHQLRHTFACNLALKDINPIKIQRLLGHSSLEMTMTYLRSLGTENMRDDINKLSI